MDIKIWRNFDFILFTAVVVVSAFGVMMVQSATLGTSPIGPLGLTGLAFRQLLYVPVCIVVMLVMAVMDYRLLESLSIPIYVINLGLLVAVLVLGHSTGGAQRWIDLKFTDLQPSEFAKVLLVITLARFFSGKSGRARSLPYLILSGVLVAPVLALVFRQPDLGTTMVIAALWIGLVLVAGTRWFYVVAGLALVVPAFLFAWDHVLLPYQRDRLTIFLDPGKDPLGQGFNILQARIAVGSGGWFGQGYLSGLQSQLHFLRVGYADFIFSVIAEEFGFFGALALFIMYLVIIWRLIRTAAYHSTAFGSYLAVGVASVLLFQVFVNIGMNVGLLPVTGIPLPFVSYGGSSLLSLFAGIGMVQSVAMRRKPPI